MTQPSDARLLQQLVPADEGGGSGIPGGAQRPVPAESCDLRARINEAVKAIKRAQMELENAQGRERDAWEYWYDLQRERMASKTHVGGNGERSDR